MRTSVRGKRKMDYGLWNAPLRTNPKKKQFNCATHPTRSWSAYPTPAYLCHVITSLLRLRHRLIFQQWWHLPPQSLCLQQSHLLRCLPWCVLMWFQRIQRKWYFLHKSCANQPKLFRCGRWSSWGMRVFTWDLTSSPEVGRWQEGLWHGLFFPVCIFSLTSSLRCQKGHSLIKLHLFDTE